MTQTLAYSLIPIGAMLACAALALKRAPGQGLVSLFQHFAGGVVFAAVALDRFPTLGAMAIGFLGFGVACLLYLVIEELFEEAHRSKDTPLIAAAFFLGFLLSFLLARLV